MNTIIIIIAVILIALILLQAGKSEGASSALTGGNDSLFQNRKERGGELFITRLTGSLGFIFMALCVIVAL